MRTVWQVLQVAFTYIGTVVGAGFATGQEILQFFTRYGWLAALTIGVSCALFTWLGIKLMLMAHDGKARSYEDLNRMLFGRRFGSGLSLFTMVVLFGVTTIMLAGGGSLFEEQLHLSYQTGLLITLAAAYLVLTRGMKAILAVNTLVVPFMILLSVTIVLISRDLPGASNWLRLTSDYPTLRIWLSPLLYTAFNLAMAQAVLVPLGASIRDRRVLYWGGLVGGVGIGLMLLAAHFALSAQMPGIRQFEIPMGHIIRTFGGSLHLLYTLVIYGEIFTTFIADAYGLALQLEQRLKLNRRLLIALILILSYFVSQIGFSHLLATLYPLFGLVSLLWFGMIIARRRGTAQPPSEH
ncbi:putative membrane protein YkvI [Paenibacillus sp. J31TS4]|uniref:YkvI family membrane protein n=1 Tax=Paenibacillus sp. J31TS4 TaxID=2807195 RepID=UPI001B0BBA4E|nr:hypothetical protein [Paenibacillus sp. J31TS4]GIP37935.1 putative membrane protein YkvI [Paenibacillus sp. J31TS4]